MAERILLRLAGAVFARPRWIAAACLLTAIAGAVVVSRMPLRTDLLEALPAGNPAITAFVDFFHDFGVADGLLVVVETDKASPDILIEMVESLGERLGTSSLLENVDYNIFRSNARLVAEHFPVYLDKDAAEKLSARLTPDGIRRQVRRNLETLRAPFAFPLEGEFIRRDPLNLREIIRDSMLRRMPASSLDLGTGYYMDSTHTMAILTARPKGSYKDMAFVGKLQREIQRISNLSLEELGRPAGVKIRIAGGYARAAEAAATIWRDIAVSFATSFVLVLLLIYLSFKPSLTVLGIFIVTLFSALSWTLLLAYLLYGGLNIVTSIVAAMLIGMYVDYMLNLYKRFDEYLRKMGEILPALQATFTGTGKALLSGSTTTSLAFFSVVVTQFRGLHELGVIAGFGILFCLAATFLLMGSLLVDLAKTRPERLAAGRPGGIPMGWLAAFIARRGKWVSAGLVLFCLVAAAGFGGTRFDAGVDSLGVRESAVGEVEKRIGERIGKLGEPLFLVARPATVEKAEADFEAMERQGLRWRQAGLVGRFLSPGAFLPPPSAQREAREWLSLYGLPGRYSGADLERRIRAETERQGMVADAGVGAYAGEVARALSDDRPMEMRDLSRAGVPRAGYFYNEGKGAFAAHVTSPGTRWESPALTKLEEDVRAMGSDFTLVGPALIFHLIRDQILWESGLAILISFLGNIFIVRFHFRNWTRIFIVMLPVTVGTLLTVGTMGLAGMPFNFFNVAAIALIFGFGVDYGIYMMQSEIEDGVGDGVGSLLSVGGTVALCALTTIVSCGSLMTTQYRGLSSIGSVLCLGAMYSLLSSLVLLPLVLQYLGRNGAPT